MSGQIRDWTAFGRIDEDGTVYVKTAAGERVVGSWQAGTPDEGLAHFARRFDDIVTEVDLIEARLGSGAADPGQTLVSLRRLRSGLDTAHVVGDLDGMAARLDKLATTAEEKSREARAARDVARVEALARKTALAEEAEKIGAESAQWKSAGDRLRAILEEWKAIKGIDKKTDAELWKRYSAARDAFTRRRGTHFASLDAVRKQATGQKEQLVTEAESLAQSSDWAATGNRLKELMTEWKAAPRAAKDVEQRLWERFRAAQDAFFARRSETHSTRDTEQKATLDRRHALLAEAEALDVEADPRAAQARLREILNQWHEAGRAATERAGRPGAGRAGKDGPGALDRRLRAFEEKVRTTTETTWRRTTPDTNPLLAQMREQVAEAEQRLARAEAAGDPKRVREAQEALAAKRRFLGLAEHSS